MKSRRMRWSGHVACRRKKRNAHKSLVGKHEGKRPLGKSRHRWKDNISMYLRETGWEGVDLHLAQNRDQWLALCEHGNESCSIKRQVI
jgi:hypothetical protein